jgi:hypothetical protein
MTKREEERKIQRDKYKDYNFEGIVKMMKVGAINNGIMVDSKYGRAPINLDYFYNGES